MANNKSTLFVLVFSLFLNACGSSNAAQAPADTTPISPAFGTVTPRVMYHLGTIATGNTAPVVIGTSAYPTELLTLDLGQLEEGDLIQVEAYALMDKGSASGDTLVLIRSTDGTSGTGQILFSTSTIDLEDRRYVPAGGRIQVWLSGLGRVVTGGQTTLYLKSASANSESTSNTSQVAMRVHHMRLQ